MSELRITGISVDLVRWPLKMKRRHGVGDIEGSMPGVIVKISTNAGIVGWGEASPWSVFTGTAEANASAIHLYMRPLVVGADPLKVSTLMRQIEKTIVGHTEGKAAVEMALLDIVGKHLGLPVAQLLGGYYRSEVPLSVSIANPDFEEDCNLAKALVADGVNIFKVKTGFSTHKEDLRRLEWLRANLPATVDLRVDYNQGLDPWNAIRHLKDVEAFRPTFIEQPVKREQRAAMAAITKAIDTPIMADESVFTPTEAIDMVRGEIADLVSIKIMKSGGIARAREIAAIAEAAGITAYGGTMFGPAHGGGDPEHFAWRGILHLHLCHGGRSPEDADRDRQRLDPGSDRCRPRCRSRRRQYTTHQHRPFRVSRPPAVGPTLEGESR